MPNFVKSPSKKTWVLAAFLMMMIFSTPLFFADAQNNDQGLLAKWVDSAITLTADGAAIMMSAIFGAIEAILMIFLGMTGPLLDSAVLFSITSITSNDSLKEIITLGWTTVRNTANMFFIFILLGISIATILRVEGYGAKQLLVRLIVVALLINFSMPITNTIIDVSNILAHQFYNSAKMNSNGISLPTINTSGIQRKILNPNPILPTGQAAQQYLEEIQKIIDKQNKCIEGSWFFDDNCYNDSLKEQNKVREKYTLEPVADNADYYINLAAEKATNVLLIIILIFIFFALIVLFVIRAVALAILIILSPMAFLFMVLPYTKSYASQWWEALFKQALFAPAALFFLYLALSIPKPGGAVAAFSLFHFIIVTTMLIASLTVSQKLGAAGASTAIAWGRNGYKATSGYIGKHGAMLARRSAAVAAKPMAEGRGISRIPLVGGVAVRGAQRVMTGRRKDIEESAKKLESLTDKELKARYGSAFGTEKAAILNTLAKRGNLKTEGGFDNRAIEQGKKLLEDAGMSTGKIGSLAMQYTDIGGLSQKARAGDKEAQAELNKIFANINNKQVREAFEEGGKAAKDMAEALRSLGGTMEEVVASLRGGDINNTSLANYLQHGTASSLIRASIETGARQTATGEKSKIETTPERGEVRETTKFPNV